MMSDRQTETGDHFFRTPEVMKCRENMKVADFKLQHPEGETALVFSRYSRYGLRLGLYVQGLTHGVLGPSVQRPVPCDLHGLGVVTAGELV